MATIDKLGSSFKIITIIENPSPLLEAADVAIAARDNEGLTRVRGAIALELIELGKEAQELHAAHTRVTSCLVTGDPEGLGRLDSLMAGS